MGRYFLGLDMGTNSVGWAVTDDTYHLLRAKGKDMWGMREFPEASTAVDRRSHRTARRRRQRELVRRGYLRGYFDDAIKEIDPDFFARLDNSRYYLEDKDDKVKYKNGVFNDENFSDRDYFKKYPTIYHLRMAIIRNEDHAAEDPRLVYLALANMFKHRGNFLNAGLSEKAGNVQMEEAWTNFKNVISSVTGEEFKAINPKDVTDILKNRNYSRTRKYEKLVELLDIDRKKKNILEVIKAVSGRKFDLKKIFTNVETDEKLEPCFADGSYEDFIGSVSSILSEDMQAFLESAKTVYDIGSIAEIMQNFRYLSEARISAYDKHKSDLKKLKRVFAVKLGKEKYDMMFRSEEPGSYSAYVGSYNSGEKHRRNMKGRSRDDFYKKIRECLKDIQPDDDIKSILEDIEAETFMPKMLTSANGVIPNQIHLREMNAILDTASEYMPFLVQKTDCDLTVRECIVELFRFRLPYYVGPVSNKNGKGNGWAVRLEDGPVLPWNLDTKIDIRKTKEEFINRLIRQCTYISGEKVLPKGSLIYEKFQVLNEINNLRINDQRIDVSLKQDIFNDLFKKGKRVTRKNLFTYLKNKGYVEEDSQISGIDAQVNNALTSYGRFLPIFKDNLERDSVKEQVENIIKYCTIYGDDKTELKRTLHEKFGDLLNESDIKRIAGYKFADWGRLSYAFLTLPGIDKDTGEETSIIRALWDTNYNMMELIHSDRYTFSESLQEKTVNSARLLNDFTHDDLDDYYFSAPVKRMVWQTVLIIREVVQVMGKSPDRIFIEMTRTDEEKGDNGRTSTRANQLKELYKSIKEADSDYWLNLIDREDKSGRLRSKKMYLYLTQMGRDMYTGEPIDLDNLFNKDYYDIDHIYPRHFVKDDNLMNNLVLVSKKDNNEKSDTYPLDAKIRNNKNVRTLWNTLKSHDLINDVKYHRLTGSEPFTNEQKAGFIARQIVETGQATKGVADIIKQLLPEAKIVYSKAGNVSDFRNKFGIFKSRAVNDFHHANDAYLNIVVGNAYYTKFTDNPMRFIKEEYAKDRTKFEYNLGKMFEHDIARNGYVAWKATSDGSEPGTIRTVKQVIAKSTPTLSMMSYCVRGAISDQTLYGKNIAKEGVYLPLKTSDSRLCNVEKYGGFNKATGSYFFLVEHTLKGKRVRTIEAAPLYLVYEKTDNDQQRLLDYCTNILKLVDPDIRLAKIPVQSLVKVNGYFVYITGRSVNSIMLKNAVSMKLSAKYTRYIHYLEKYKREDRINSEISDVENIELYRAIMNKHDTGIYTLRPNPSYKVLKDGENRFLALEINDQCNVLLEILNLTSIGVQPADLTAIGASKNTGKMKMNKKITGNSEVVLINRSVTGLYESQVDLLTV